MKLKAIRNPSKVEGCHRTMLKVSLREGSSPLWGLGGCIVQNYFF